MTGFAVPESLGNEDEGSGNVAADETALTRVPLTRSEDHGAAADGAAKSSPRYRGDSLRQKLRLLDLNLFIFSFDFFKLENLRR